MNILAANDDGVKCAGILLLADALREAGHRVMIIAPHRNRSGASHSLSFTGNIEVKKMLPDVWACRGTPADCVAAGLSGYFPFRPDLTVSGINAGANLGSDLIYSGTAAAARQSAVHGIPGIAFSLTGNMPYAFSEAAHWAARHLAELAALWTDEVFINVNFPPILPQDDGWELTFPTRRTYDEGMSLTDGPHGWQSLAFTSFAVRSANEAGSDGDAVTRGRVAVSRVCLLPGVLVEI